jgi:hypothetical protein
MKRLTAAGLFATIGGVATLLLVASILYSCRQGGHPHDMGTQSWTPSDTDATSTLVSAPLQGTDATEVRVSVSPVG